LPKEINWKWKVALEPPNPLGNFSFPPNLKKRGPLLKKGAHILRKELELKKD